MDENFLIMCVVEDNESVRKALSRLLRSNGYHVAAFESGEEFLRWEIPSDKVCLILDIQLQGMSGFDVYERLMAKGMNVPVIFITACENPQWKEKAEKTEGAGFLQKPFRNQSLLQAIDFACRRRWKAGSLA